MIKEIKDFPNYYISKEGEVISKRTGKPLSSWVDNTGYYQCLLYKNGNKYHKRVHRLMGDLFLVKTEDDKTLEVNHIDGNKLNNHIDNLELVESGENTLHGYNKGLYKTNARYIKVKATKKDDDSIVFVYKSIRALSEDLKLNRKTVSAIIFEGKTNNYEYVFEPIIKEDFYFIEITNAKTGNILAIVPSIMQASEVTGVERHYLSDIINNKTTNKTSYFFKKLYKNQATESRDYRKHA